MKRSTAPQAARRACRLLLVAAACGAATAATAEPGAACGALTNHYGPFDYRTQRAKLGIVEQYHFTPQVEALLRGKSSTSVGADLSYLMRTSPNHHRGLIAVVRLAEKTRSLQPKDLQYPVECYFDRALRFRQDDTVVRVLYAQFLHKQRRGDEALAQLQAARGFAQDNALSHHSIGLAYFELGAWDEALAQAHKARALGFQGTDLESQLKSQGRWRDPEG